MTLAVILLAAGASSRMRGRDKLVEEVAGQPLLRTMAERALTLGGPVLVALPAPDHPRAALLAGTGITAVPVPDAASGMAASIRTAVAALPEDTLGVMVLPGDMPDLTAAELAAVAAAWRGAPDRVHRATAADGTPGHPVIFPARLFPAMSRLQGDMGARPLLADEKVVAVPLPGTRATTDLDTPEAWADWRARQG